jgi:alpha-mannosidase
MIADRAESAEVPPVRVNGRTLTNGIISATIDETGQVSSLQDCEVGHEACARRPHGARRPLNQLVLYGDRPRAWEAWDIDAEYEEKACPVDDPAEVWQVVEDGPLRAAIEVTRPLGQQSQIKQRYVLEAGSPRLDVRSRVEWHENRRLLRALFPVDVRSRRATYEIQFGHVERPTHRNTSWDRAMFEVCAHRWMDLSEPGFGVALLNDCKYGHSCHGQVMGLSLLRSPKFPDPQADTGPHEFTYSLMIHHGDWRAAGVDRQADALNDPLLACPLPPDQSGPIEGSWAPFVLRTAGAACVTVAALKRAEDDERLILRLVETHGGRGRLSIHWNLPVGEVEGVDLLERPASTAEVTHDPAARRTVVSLRPFQIVTLAAQLT